MIWYFLNFAIFICFCLNYCENIQSIKNLSKRSFLENEKHSNKYLQIITLPNDYLKNLKIYNDNNKHILVYKDSELERCYLEKFLDWDSLSKKLPINEWRKKQKYFHINRMYIVNFLNDKQIFQLAGKNVFNFCEGLNTYLIDEIQHNSKDNYFEERFKRSSNDHFRKYHGQTQTQFLSFGDGKDNGKAEAESTYEGSRALVTGQGGIGQAQSQSGFESTCENCEEYSANQKGYPSTTSIYNDFVQQKDALQQNAYPNKNFQQPQNIKQLNDNFNPINLQNPNQDSKKKILQPINGQRFQEQLPKFPSTNIQQTSQPLNNQQTPQETIGNRQQPNNYLHSGYYHQPGNYLQQGPSQIPSQQLPTFLKPNNNQLPQTKYPISDSNQHIPQTTIKQGNIDQKIPGNQFFPNVFGSNQTPQQNFQKEDYSQTYPQNNIYKTLPQQETQGNLKTNTPFINLNQPSPNLNKPGQAQWNQDNLNYNSNNQDFNFGKQPIYSDQNGKQTPVGNYDNTNLHPNNFHQSNLRNKIMNNENIDNTKINLNRKFPADEKEFTVSGVFSGSGKIYSKHPNQNEILFKGTSQSYLPGEEIKQTFPSPQTINNYGQTNIPEQSNFSNNFNGISKTNGKVNANSNLNHYGQSTIPNQEIFPSQNSILNQSNVLNQPNQPDQTTFNKIFSQTNMPGKTNLNGRPIMPDQTYLPGHPSTSVQTDVSDQKSTIHQSNIPVQANIPSELNIPYHKNYPNQGNYEGQVLYPNNQNGYLDQVSYPAKNNYPIQTSYPSQNSFPEHINYSDQTNYPAQTDSSSKNNFPGQTNYPNQINIPSPNSDQRYVSSQQNVPNQLQNLNLPQQKNDHGLNINNQYGTFNQDSILPPKTINDIYGTSPQIISPQYLTPNAPLPFGENAIGNHRQFSGSQTPELNTNSNQNNQWNNKYIPGSQISSNPFEKTQLNYQNSRPYNNLENNNQIISNQNLQQGITQPNLSFNEESDSIAESSIQQLDTGIQTSASAGGSYKNGTTKAKVTGTYTGSGSFSAQAGSEDQDKSAQTQISGGPSGSSSSAQGRGARGKSQTQVKLDPSNGGLTSEAQTNGNNYGTNAQVKANNKGGMADAQASGIGSTSSQAQIGFQPNQESIEMKSNDFRGGGTASARHNNNNGQSQSQISGKFKHGISYSGAAQADSGSKNEIEKSRNRSRIFQIAHDTKFIINDVVETTISSILNSSNEILLASETKGNINSSVIMSTTILPKIEKSPGEATQSNLEEDDDNDDYDYDYHEDALLSESNQVNQIENTKRNIIKIKQEYPSQTQSITLNTPSNIDTHIIQKEDHLDEGMLLNSGQIIPGTNNFRIPVGFRGRVTSISKDNEAIALSGANGDSQAQSIKLTSGTGQLITKESAKNVRSINLNEEDYTKYKPKYVSVSKSITGNYINRPLSDKKITHTHYSKSSSCGYFTFTCSIVSGTNGRTKICKPKAPIKC